MGVLISFFGGEERRDHPSSLGESVLAAFGGGYESASGVTVTPDSAMGITAAYACVRVISETAAMLPLLMLEKLGPGKGKRRATGHPYYSLLHDQPNPEMTAMEFREALTAHVVMRGNAYAEMELNRDGSVRWLWPLRPDAMTPARVGGRLIYAYRLPNGESVSLGPERVLHLHGLSFDGLIGYNPVYLQRQMLGLAAGTDEFAARYFGNGAKPGTVLTHPGKLSKEAQDRLIASVERRHGGLENAHRLMVLEEGMAIESIGFDLADAQFLETRNYQGAAVARMFRMQLHKIQIMSASTNNNIEQQALEFLQDTMQPWFVRWEQRLRMSLLSPADKGKYAFEHLIDGILRADITSRYEAFSKGILTGFMSRNEVRERENLNPVDGLDVMLEPLNMGPAGGAGAGTGGQGSRGAIARGEWRIVDPGAAERAAVDGQAEQRAQSTAKDRRSLAKAQVGMITDVAGRMVRRETNDVGRAVTKYLDKGQDVAGFLLWLDEFYTEHEGFVTRNMLPTFEAIGKLVLASVARELGQDGLTEDEAKMLAEVQTYVEVLGHRWALSSANQIRAIVRMAAADGNLDVVEQVNERLAGWDETQAGKVGRRESNRSVNAFAYMAYGVAGVTLYRWVTSGSDTCPYCQSLSGKVVGRDVAFVSAGDFQPDGVAAPMLVRRSSFHPPIHDGCDCSIVAG